MKKPAYLAALALLILTACARQEGAKFHVTGEITGAKDTMLYLEHLTLDRGPVAIDSARLGDGGAFDLKGDTVGNPEFYRLRIGGKAITLSIDSTETVTVRAALPTMDSVYTVEGSGNCDTIRIIAQRQRALLQAVSRTANDRRLTLEEREAEIDRLIADYKTDIKLRFVQNRYDRASSYYAMFQQVDGQNIFNPVSDASDVTWFTAIATAWAERWPGAVRTQNLLNIVMQGRRNTRHKTVTLEVDNDKIKETGIIDMGFPDLQGRERRLSTLRGHVVLLDFTSYAMQGSQERTLALRELYNRYHARGLQIYQVSLDPDEHYWKTMSAQLPWVAVWNAEGLDNDIVRIYNLQTLPTWFLIDRQNNLAGRMELMGNLEEEILKLL